MASRKRMGAPPKPSKEKKKAHITCWMTEDQKALIERAAKQDGDPPGPWLRKAGERAARAKLLGEGS